VGGERLCDSSWGDFGLGELFLLFLLGSGLPGEGALLFVVVGLSSPGGVRLYIASFRDTCTAR
jgi:hypothetical protein